MDLLTLGDLLYTRYFHFVPSPDGLISAAENPNCLPAVVRWRIEQVVRALGLSQTRATQAHLEEELQSQMKLLNLISERRTQAIAAVPFTAMPQRVIDSTEEAIAHVPKKYTLCLDYSP
jgi:hypothetical protein